MSDSNNQNDVLRLHDPEALQRENTSLRERLARLEQQNVIEGRFVGEAPRYLVNDPGVVLDDTLWPGGTTIDYIGVPNMSMVPLNDPAKRAMEDLIARLENGARKVAARNGREFLGLHNLGDRNQLLDLAMADAKNQADSAPIIRTPEPTQGVPAMPHLVQDVVKRGRGRPPKVVASQPAQSARPATNADLGAPMLAAAPHERAIVGRVVQ
jgi:hypothetical protein